MQSIYRKDADEGSIGEINNNVDRRWPLVDIWQCQQNINFETKPIRGDNTENKRNKEIAAKISEYREEQAEHKDSKATIEGKERTIAGVEGVQAAEEGPEHAK